MAKPKATHYGECQCCGSRQKLPGGKLSLHGYTVNKSHGYAFFNGVCVGAGELPFERSCDLIKGFIAQTERQKNFLKTRVEELRQPTTDNTKVWLYLYVRGSYAVRGYYAWFEVAMTMENQTFEQGTPGEFTIARFSYESPVGETQGKIVELRETYHYSYPKSIAELAANANEKYARSLETDIERAQRYIDWQTHRVNTWTEKPLTPIS